MKELKWSLLVKVSTNITSKANLPYSIFKPKIVKIGAVQERVNGRTALRSSNWDWSEPTIWREKVKVYRLMFCREKEGMPHRNKENKQRQKRYHKTYTNSVDGK